MFLDIMFNLNYIIVFGLAICIVLLIYMLVNIIFIKKPSGNSLLVKNNEDLHNDIDFFNPKIKIINKAKNTITDKETNKKYIVIDHDDKIIFMELDVYEPDDYQKNTSDQIIQSQGIGDIVIPDNNDYVPEPVNDNITKTIEELLEEGKEMSETIESAVDYNAIQKDFLEYNDD